MDVSGDNPLYSRIKKIKEKIDGMRRITGKLIKITRYEIKNYLKGKVVDIDKAIE
jgi:hypothetical protein